MKRKELGRNDQAGTSNHDTHLDTHIHQGHDLLFRSEENEIETNMKDKGDRNVDMKAGDGFALDENLREDVDVDVDTQRTGTNTNKKARVGEGQGQVGDEMQSELMDGDDDDDGGDGNHHNNQLTGDRSIMDEDGDVNEDEGDCINEEAQATGQVEVPGSSDLDKNKQPRFKLRKVAMFLGYLGANYCGMQRNHDTPTVELELEKALNKSGVIPDALLGFFDQIQWSRAARTDKGVSAAGQVVSFKMKVFDKSQGDESTGDPDKELAEKINQCLPKDIHVYGCKQATRGFAARQDCDQRMYEYLFPVYMLLPHTLPSTFRKPAAVPQAAEGAGVAVEEGKADAPMQVEKQVEDPNEKEKLIRTEIKQAVNKLNKLLAMYVGSHPFHNFTEKMEPTDPSVVRYMIGVHCEPDPIMLEGMVLDGNTLLRIKLRGQSFILHQIRNMIGLAFQVYQGRAPWQVIPVALNARCKVTIPMAPALGLLLDECLFVQYNRKFKRDLDATGINFTDFLDDKEAFKRSRIYPYIYQRERELKGLYLWMKKVNGSVTYTPSEIMEQYRSNIENPGSKGIKGSQEQQRSKSLFPLTQDASDMFAPKECHAEEMLRLDAQVAKVDQLRSVFQEQFGAPATFFTRVPATLCIVGQFMGELGMRIIGCPVNKYTLAAICRTRDSQLIVALPDEQAESQWGKEEIPVSETREKNDSSKFNRSRQRSDRREKKRKTANNSGSDDVAERLGPIVGELRRSWLASRTAQGQKIASPEFGRILIDLDQESVKLIESGKPDRVINDVLGIKYSIPLTMSFAYMRVNRWRIPRMEFEGILCKDEDAAHSARRMRIVMASNGEHDKVLCYNFCKPATSRVLDSVTLFQDHYLAVADLSAMLSKSDVETNVAVSDFLSTVQHALKHYHFVSKMVSTVLTKKFGLGNWQTDRLSLGEVLLMLEKRSELTGVNATAVERIKQLYKPGASPSVLDSIRDYDMQMHVDKLLRTAGAHEMPEPQPNAYTAIPVGKYLYPLLEYAERVLKWDDPDYSMSNEDFLDFFEQDQNILRLPFGDNCMPHNNIMEKLPPAIAGIIKASTQEFGAVKSKLIFNSSQTALGLLSIVPRNLAADYRSKFEANARNLNADLSAEALHACMIELIPTIGVSTYDVRMSTASQAV